MKDARAEKAGKPSILDVFTFKFRDWAVPKVPLWIEPYHLTLMTILWSAGIILSGWLAFRYSNLHWFWLSSLFIAMQWVTDVLDGAVGRARNGPWIRWGFFMDHFLDYVFLCSILISYVFTLPVGYHQYSLYTLAVLAGFMVNSFLYFGAVGKFQISYHGIGPTETRIAFIILNAIVIFATPAKLAFLFPWVLAGAILVLIYVSYRDQREIWAIDTGKREKENRR